MGVPVLPGVLVDLNDQESIYPVVQRIGYPLLVKASAGGGGKGIALGMECALRELVVEGVVTNIPFHLLVMRNRRFLNGEYTTRCARQLFSKLSREGIREELGTLRLP